MPASLAQEEEGGRFVENACAKRRVGTVVWHRALARRKGVEPMYVGVLCGTIAPGRTSQVREWAPRIARATAKAAEREVKLLFPVTGDLGSVLWTIQYSDLADYERTGEKVVSNAEYQRLVAEGSPLLSSLTQTIYRVAQ